jgi:hypothetical protein
MVMTLRRRTYRSKYAYRSLVGPGLGGDGQLRRKQGFVDVALIRAARKVHTCTYVHTYVRVVAVMCKINECHGKHARRSQGPGRTQTGFRTSRCTNKHRGTQVVFVSLHTRARNDYIRTHVCTFYDLYILL